MTEVKLHHRHATAISPRRTKVLGNDKVTTKLNSNAVRYAITAREELFVGVGTTGPFAAFARRILERSGIKPTTKQVRKRAQRLSEQFMAPPGPPWQTIEH